MVNFGPLAAEIGLPVWGTPPNFNGFRVLAALLHGSQLGSVSQNLRRWKERHLCSAGRPSRWALAHISSWMLFYMASEHFKNCIVRTVNCMYAAYSPTLDDIDVRIHRHCLPRNDLYVTSVTMDFKSPRLCVYY